MSIDARSLRNRLAWISEGPGPLSNGNQTTIDAPSGVFWARVEPLSAWSQYIAQEQTAGALFEITLRTGPAIQTGDKLRDEATGRVFSVVTVKKGLKRNDPLVITASENAGS